MTPILDFLSCGLVQLVPLLKTHLQSEIQQVQLFENAAVAACHC